MNESIKKIMKFFF